MSTPQQSVNVEWGVRDQDGAVWSGGGHLWTEAEATRAANRPGDVLVTRTITVTEWVSVNRRQTGPEGGEQRG